MRGADIACFCIYSRCKYTIFFLKTIKKYPISSKINLLRTVKRGLQVKKIVYLCVFTSSFDPYSVNLRHNAMHSPRGSFTSRFGATVAVGGSVVGLGNIWRFPYVAGENGGAAFIVVYILMSFLVAVPVMLSELSIGRQARRSLQGGMARLAPGRPWWKFTGTLGVVTALVIVAV